MRYTVHVTRSVSTEVQVEAAGWEFAIEAVDRRDFPLPDPDEWHVLKDSYVYEVDGVEWRVNWPGGRRDQGGESDG